jgi:predicted dehydrogenase
VKTALVGGERRTEQFKEDVNEAYLREARHFADCVKGNRTPLVPLSDGVEVLKIAIAAKKSSALGKPVVLK